MRHALLITVLVTAFGAAAPAPASACNGEVCELVCDAADLVIHTAIGGHVQCR